MIKGNLLNLCDSLERHLKSIGLNNQQNNTWLLDPFYINKQYISLGPAWRAYMQQYEPEKKLIVFGFCPVKEHKNYIDILNIPANINEFMANALPASQMEELPVDGGDIRDKLWQFLRGHGQDDLAADIANWQNTFDFAYVQYDEWGKEFQDIWNQTLEPMRTKIDAQLLDRWKRYNIYFDFLPKEPNIQQYNELFEQIHHFFSPHTSTQMREPLLVKILNGLRDLVDTIAKIQSIYLK